jgi:hypothetical protein
MNFPISIAFKILTLIPQLYVKDASGKPFAYVRRKFWALKEDVTVYADDTQSRPLYRIKADRIIDWSANYRIANMSDATLGVVRRKGARSLWRAHYEILIGDTQVFTVRERSALVRFLDLIIGEIPIVGLLTGYFLNPMYDVTREGGAETFVMTKQRALFESQFQIAKTGAATDDEEIITILALMMIVFLERSRG